MKFLSLVLLMTLSLASFAQAYDGSGYRGFTVCTNSSQDYLVIDHYKGVFSFHDPEIYNKYTILGTDYYADDEGRGPVDGTEYYVFNEDSGLIFNILRFRSGVKEGRLETNTKRSKTLKTYANCEWKLKL